MAAFCIPVPGRVQVDKIDGRTRAEERAPERIVERLADFTPTRSAIHRREVFVDACLRTLGFTENVTFWQYLASGPPDAARSD